MTNQRYRNTYIDGCSHFCTASIVDRLDISLDIRMCRLVINACEKYRRKYDVNIEGYVIMPNHIHLLIRGTAKGVEKFMQYSLSQISRQVRNLLEKRAGDRDREAKEYLEVILLRASGKSTGKVWKERFRCVALDKEDVVLVKLQYIHNNPVKRGLVERAEEWQ